jgi:hypothetical protein
MYFDELIRQLAVLIGLLLYLLPQLSRLIKRRRLEEEPAPEAADESREPGRPAAERSHYDPFEDPRARAATTTRGQPIVREDALARPTKLGVTERLERRMHASEERAAAAEHEMLKRIPRVQATPTAPPLSKPARASLSKELLVEAVVLNAVLTSRSRTAAASARATMVPRRALRATR